MTGNAIALATLAAGVAALLLAVHGERTAPEEETLAHTRSEFSFRVAAPIEAAAPLFGAEAERGWGGREWSPRFLYPQPAADVQGAVFVVKHGPHDSTWVATAQDFAGGHVQYVNFIDGAVATLIDIHLRPASPQETAVLVVYERTALRAEWNSRVRELAARDAASGPEWAAAIRQYLAASRRPAANP